MFLVYYDPSVEQNVLRNMLEFMMSADLVQYIKKAALFFAVHVAVLHSWFFLACNQSAVCAVGKYIVRKSL